MRLTASKLRQGICRILDRILETGQPVEIERRRRKLKIVPEPRVERLQNLTRKPYLLVDPEELLHLDWSQEWRP